MTRVVLALLLLARNAHADSTAADQLFAEGRALLEADDAAGACKKFNTAVALDPTAAGIVLNLGLCYERLGKYATSLVWFRRAQALAAEQQLDPAYKDAAEQHTVALAAKVALARIDVSRAPASVEVKLDGRVVVPADYNRLEVDADSILEASAPGFQPFRTQLTAITGRDAGTITITLTPDTRGRRTRLLGLGLTGSGLLTVGGGFLYALHVQNTYEDRVDAFNRDPSSYTDTQSLAERRATAESDLRYKATTIITIGAALIATGAIVYFTAPSSSTTVTPMLGPELAGVAAAGSF